MALTPSYLQKCTDGIEGEYQKLVTEILVDMAKRIATAKGMTSTTEYLNLKLREMSLHQQFINRALAKVLNTTEEEVEKLMQESTYKSTRDTFTQLEKHGYDTSGLEFAAQIEKSTNIAKNELTNLTRTTGQLATSQMMNLYDQAYLQVASGAYSYDQAVTNAIKKLAKEGLGEVTYPTGARRSVESAVRVAVRTSVAQNALKCEEDMLDDMDINLVEVSSHLGARPSHAVWQGKIYWRNHPEGNYENFYEATGYGTATGLGGYNCRHQFYPFFGDEQTYYHIDETVNQKAYEMEQTQRSLERKLREWDRKDKILTAGGQDNTEAKRWKSYYKQKLNELVKSSGGFLKRDYSAEKAWSAPDLKKTQKQGSEIKRVPVLKRLSDKVDLSKQNVDLNPEKQSKHTTDGKIFLDHLAKTGKKYSYFTITTSELEKLIKSYAGSGYKQYSKDKQTGNYLWNNKEIVVENHKNIGYVVKGNGTEIPTRYFKIHYSKTGVHLVPLDPKMGDKYAKIHTEGVSISLHGRD